MNPSSLDQELTLLTGTPCTPPGKLLALPARIQAGGLRLKLDVFCLEPQFQPLPFSASSPSLCSKPPLQAQERNGTAGTLGVWQQYWRGWDCIPSRPPGLGSRPFQARKDHVGAGRPGLRWPPARGCERAMAPAGTPPQWSSPTQPFPSSLPGRPRPDPKPQGQPILGKNFSAGT